MEIFIYSLLLVEQYAYTKMYYDVLIVDVFLFMKKPTTSNTISDVYQYTSWRVVCVNYFFRWSKITINFTIIFKNLGNINI